ncbi:hypothetical protein [Metallibacterium sp.]|uniref:hypothetical protein n=1 Tax=Metallibacterium sp. TaxID=2940281 RepID=UPI0026021DD3|nr:hypothetical protein [Metallibacterium sp.]
MTTHSHPDPIATSASIRAELERQQQAGINLAEDIAVRAHAAILAQLAGVDPDALEAASDGRVRCAPEHRATLRTMLQAPESRSAQRKKIQSGHVLEAGAPLPWRLEGSVQAAIGAARQRWSAIAPPVEPWPLGPALLAAFLGPAAHCAQCAGWLFRLNYLNAAALTDASVGELVRVSLQSPLKLHFEPVPAPERIACQTLDALAVTIERKQLRLGA